MLTSLFSDPMGLLWQVLHYIPGVIVGFTVHEFMHAAAAVALGDPTPRNQGRLTLNPGAHIDWIGILLMLLYGYGWARPVQVQVSNLRHPRRDDILVSLAGPFSNLVLGVIFFVSLRFVTDVRIVEFLIAAYMINVNLFFLNILPIPPLDGFHVLKSLLPPRALGGLWRVERYGFLLLLLLSFTGVLGNILYFGVSFVTGALTQVFGWL